MLLICVKDRKIFGIIQCNFDIYYFLTMLTFNTLVTYVFSQRRRDAKGSLREYYTLLYSIVIT